MWLAKTFSIFLCKFHHFIVTTRHLVQLFWIFLCGYFQLIHHLQRVHCVCVCIWFIDFPFTLSLSFSLFLFKCVTLFCEILSDLKVIFITIFFLRSNFFRIHHLFVRQTFSLVIHIFTQIKFIFFHTCVCVWVCVYVCVGWSQTRHQRKFDFLEIVRSLETYTRTKKVEIFCSYYHHHHHHQHHHHYYHHLPPLSR